MIKNNTSKTLTTNKNTKNSELDNINNEINELYKKIKTMISLNNLEEAEKLKFIIINKEEQRKKLRFDVNLKIKKKTLTNLKQEHEQFIKEFHKEWKIKLIKNEKEKVCALDKLRDLHKKQLEEMNNLKNNINIKFKNNPLIKEYSKKKELLVKINQFKEAKNLERKIWKLEEKDRDKIKVEKNLQFNKLMNKLLNTHKIEINHLKNKLKRFENKLLNEKNNKFEILLKKIFNNKINEELKQDKKIKQIKVNKNYSNLKIQSLNKSQNIFPSNLSSISKNSYNVSNYSKIKRNNSQYNKFSIKHIYKY